jgi:hypothetical protein
MRPAASHPVIRPIVLSLFCIALARAEAPDPLPSWNDGPAKRGILEFVERTTDAASRGFVPVEARIAAFDNDGTLWPEKPVIEGLFILSRIKAMAEKDPSLKEKEPFKAVLNGDTAYLKEAGEEAIGKLVAETHSGMSQEAFTAEVVAFSKQAVYPKLGLPLNAVAYQPMVELLAYLRSKGYRTWLCSGGTQEFMRVFAGPLYGVPPERVIGTEVNLRFETRDRKGVLMRLPGVAALNDKEGKPVGLSRRIGLRPIFAAGNVRSGGDIAMLTYSHEAMGPTFQLLINHDDGKREFAYGENDGASLKAAREQGWRVVNMKTDWRQVFNATTGPERVGAKEPE